MFGGKLYNFEAFILAEKCHFDVLSDCGVATIGGFMRLPPLICVLKGISQFCDSGESNE